jgi:hypothetical protein
MKIVQALQNHLIHKKVKGILCLALRITQCIKIMIKITVLLVQWSHILIYIIQCLYIKWKTKLFIILHQVD